MSHLDAQGHEPHQPSTSSLGYELRPQDSLGNLRDAESRSGSGSGQSRSAGGSDDDRLYYAAADYAAADEALLPQKTKTLESDDEDEDSAGIFPPTPRSGVLPDAHLATLAEKRALWWRNVFITGMFILSWYAFATLLSLYNKWMFSPEYYGFSYPLFVSGCHMGMQFICAATIRWTMQRFRPTERPTRKEYVTRIFPTAASTGADIGLSNLSLKTITLSLYTMCKSSALIFVLIFAFMFKLEQYSLRLVSVIGLISFGVFLMVFNTTAVSVPGILMVFGASAIGGLRWALTELIMHKKAMGLSNPFATIFWLAPIMGVVLLGVSAIIESWIEIFTSAYFATPLVALRTTATIALPGGLAFAMVASEYFVIQRAGVVPLSIAGIFKEVSTITFSAWVFGDTLTEVNVVGVVVAVSGIALYSYHKYTKSLARDVTLDAYGNPLPIDEDDERAPLRPSAYSVTQSQSMSQTHSLHSRATSRGSLRSAAELQEEVQLHTLGRSSDSDDEDARRRRDEFEGWDSVGIDEEEEASDDEVQRRREERVGEKWKAWWGRSM